MKKFYRSNNNVVFAGVCGGIGEYVDIDPVIVRIITILLVIATGFFPVVIAYLLAAWLAPLRPKGNVVDEQ